MWAGLDFLGTGAQAGRRRSSGASLQSRVDREVKLTPVARYSPQERIPYGYYTAAAEVEVGVIASDQYQALNPTTEPGAQAELRRARRRVRNFHEQHDAQDIHRRRQERRQRHQARRPHLPTERPRWYASPQLIPGVLRRSRHGDYQDYVFTLSNVVPVAP